jgi:hypothetical protein
LHRPTIAGGRLHILHLGIVFMTGVAILPRRTTGKVERGVAEDMAAFGASQPLLAPDTNVSFRYVTVIAQSQKRLSTPMPSSLS